MICPACRDHRHDDCRGGSWCDCQHQRDPDRPVEPSGGPPGDC